MGRRREGVDDPRAVRVARQVLQLRPRLDYFWQKLLSYHRGSAKLLGQVPQGSPAVTRGTDTVPFYEFDFDLTQKEGITIVGDADEVAAKITAQMSAMGAGVLMGLFQF